MADTSPPPPSASLPAVSNNLDPTQYWCYQCNKQVPIETRTDQSDLICFECKNGFVESISNSHHAVQSDDEDSPAFGDEFLQVLRLIAHAAREVDAPPPPPLDPPVDNTDYLRIEIDELNNDNEDEEHELDDNNSNNNDNDVIVDEDEDDEDDVRRESRDALRNRLRDITSRAASRRNRMIDWADLLMELEDQSIEFGLHVQGVNDYVVNPGDYVDEVGYENLLNNLMENDTGVRKCAPPAAKSVVEGLHTVDLKSTDVEFCAVCKDSVFNNEGKVVKQLECGHMYHGECIIPWLGERNTCPVCRYELPTDDLEYEEDKKKKLKSLTMNVSMINDNGCSSSSSGGD